MSERRRHGFDEVEMAAVRKRLTTAGLGLWQEAEASAGLAADAEPTRHAQAIASVEASATPAETAIVDRHRGPRDPRYARAGDVLGG